MRRSTYVNSSGVYFALAHEAYSRVVSWYKFLCGVACMCGDKDCWTAREWKTFSLKNTRRLPRRYNDILSNSGNLSLPMWSEIKIIETWCYWSCRLPFLVKERKEQIVQRKVSGFSLSCRSDMNPQKRRKFRKEKLKDSRIIKWTEM